MKTEQIEAIIDAMLVLENDVNFLKNALNEGKVKIEQKAFFELQMARKLKHFEIFSEMLTESQMKKTP
jgi:hypothetical protein